MNYTDEQGRKWEEVPSENDGLKVVRIIRPVKQEPKYVVDYEGFEDHQTIKIILDFTDEDQAQLIKQSVEALMEYIDGSNDYKPDFVNPATKARNAIQKGAE